MCKVVGCYFLFYFSSRVYRDFFLSFGEYYFVLEIIKFQFRGYIDIFVDRFIIKNLVHFRYFDRYIFGSLNSKIMIIFKRMLLVSLFY